MSRISDSWHSRGFFACVLWPIALIYGLLNSLRRFSYQRGWLKTKTVQLPVVVVGNLSVGGTGKTPLCASLVDMFVANGWRPAIVSRGYGGDDLGKPRLVLESDTAKRVGDEPLMLFNQTQVPVCVCTDRSAAVEHVATFTDADIVISDDGLQHLAMPRVAQIIAIDAHRGFGNAWLLPAGPLRDRLSRLSDADLLAIQTRHSSDTFRHPSLVRQLRKLHRNNDATNTFYLQPAGVIQLVTGKKFSLDQFNQLEVHAVAGIGNPARFFDALRYHGLLVTEHAMPDHHMFKPEDLFFQDELPIVVTSKDAVKLKSMSQLPHNVATKIHEITTKVILEKDLEQKLLLLEQSLRSYRDPKY